MYAFYQEGFFSKDINININFLSIHEFPESQTHDPGVRIFFFFLLWIERLH